ncbi:MAG: hypothetical protein H6956_09470 [Chromatiaceae bacterium]|nr:hypothetical protein [Gammaproteobacteria bacterium]MCP5318137.1 hypothetical protein [Chromatiaceae bacterium]MCW5586699.1 hypothetical protein [Chromatiales bacterium]MCP5436440.1 hypothetical protein [Chromatiaceae bacterium]HOP15896.1 hypothetical protein [Gammaproteobacteria bacterium]
MKTLSFLPLALGLAILPAFAQDDAAEQLVASKQQADMSYRQLMEILGKASSMIHEGIIRENKQMVKEGADIVLHHPAPNHKPWTIMPPEDQDGFKQSLLAFDKILDEHAISAEDAATKGDWQTANSALNDLNASCISCHAMWRAKAAQ